VHLVGGRQLLGDLVAEVGAVVDRDEVAVVVAVDGADAAVVLDRQVEAAGVPGEVGDDLVARGVAVRVAGERAARAGCRGARG
jgi:hypothetical protein